MVIPAGASGKVTRPSSALLASSGWRGTTRTVYPKGPGLPSRASPGSGGCWPRGGPTEVPLPQALRCAPCVARPVQRHRAHLRLGDLVVVVHRAADDLGGDVVGSQLAQHHARPDQQPVARPAAAVLRLDMLDAHALPGRLTRCFQAASSRAAANGVPAFFFREQARRPRSGQVQAVT